MSGEAGGDSSGSGSFPAHSHLQHSSRSIPHRQGPDKDGWHGAPQRTAPILGPGQLTSCEGKTVTKRSLLQMWNVSRPYSSQAMMITRPWWGSLSSAPASARWSQVWLASHGAGQRQPVQGARAARESVSTCSVHTSPWHRAPQQTPSFSAHFPSNSKVSSTFPLAAPFQGWLRERAWRCSPTQLRPSPEMVGHEIRHGGRKLYKEKTFPKFLASRCQLHSPSPPPSIFFPLLLTGSASAPARGRLRGPRRGPVPALLGGAETL